MRIKLVITYDGRNYYGFQHQPGEANIEDTLLEAIRRIDGEVTKIFGSGRTDRFVHAKGQVVHFDTAKELKEYQWVAGINCFLPEDIRVLLAKEVPLDFHARFSAIRKEYAYYIRYKSYDIFSRNYMDYFQNLDLDKLAMAIKKLEGVHDYRGFCSAKIDHRKDSVKEIYHAEMRIYPEYIELRFVGNGFLKYQVRKMVGTLVDIAIGKKPMEIIDQIFATKDSRLSNRVVSGHGLYLVEVTYE